jgi:hypothetical protein
VETGKQAAAQPLRNDPPKIIFSTVPAILVSIDGQPVYQPVPDTKLERVVNTRPLLLRNHKDRLFLHVFDAWMTADSLDGTWQRDSSPPKGLEIEGTPLEYVVNTPTPIIMVDASSWYGVENGVWFVAPSIDGPWLVATSVPVVIYSIPYTSPLHYVTYVKVYDATADTVVVGYTPGYQGVCIDPATNVVVYGTGYAYTPWVGSVWYGPPVTYGFGASIRETPYTGWSFGFGFGWSWGAATVSVGFGWGAYPWWGPYGWGYAWGPHLYPAPYPWGGVAYGAHGGAMAWGGMNRSFGGGGGFRRR